MVLPLLAGLLLLSCAGQEPSSSTGLLSPETEWELRLEPAWIQDGLIYELFVRDFTPDGTFRAVIPRLDELADMGVSTIWLMPIHPIGAERRKGRLGSPYSISDYYAVNSAYGTLADFSALVDAIQSRGMRVILDLVINHTAWDHPWVTERPDWYTRNADGEMVPPVPDWSDVADLDFSNQLLRNELREVMQYWVRDFDIDGYRVDTASMIPRDFWEESIPTVQALKPVLFLAESADTSLRSAGFQLIYDWPGYARLKEAYTRGRAINHVYAAARELPPGDEAGYLRFTTNHDETAWDAAPPVLFGGQAGAQAAAVAHLLLPGVPMLYNGQEVGNTESWAFFDVWQYNWDANPETREFYTSLGQAWAASPALRFGELRVLPNRAGRSVVSYLRVAEGQRVMVLANISAEPQQPRLPETVHGTWEDLLGGADVRLSEDTALPPYGYLVLSLE